MGRLREERDRYIQVRTPPSGAFNTDPPKVDVYMVHPPASWGVLKAIRTGPAELGKFCVTELRRRGWRCHRGALWAPADSWVPRPDGDRFLELEGVSYERVPCPYEEDFFRACMVGYRPPTCAMT